MTRCWLQGRADLTRASQGRLALRDPYPHVPLTGDAQHAALAGPLHTTRPNPARCDGAVLPARLAGARLPIPRAGSSSEDQVRLEGGEAEPPAADGQGQR